MSQSAKPKKAEAMKRGGGAQKIYENIRASILNLDRKPGEPLDEASLSQQFGMSRSPVREALIRLSTDGLVVTLPNKSTLVAPLNINDYPTYLDALDLVQRYTTRLAAKLRTAEDLRCIAMCQAEFTNALDEGNVPWMIEANRSFHMAISETARNSYFNFLHARLLDDGRRMLHLYFRSFEGKIPTSIRRDHDLIIDSITKQNGEEAEKNAHQHVTQVGGRFMEYLNRRHSKDFEIFQFHEE